MLDQQHPTLRLYALLLVTMLSSHQQRHAALVGRSGALPTLVSIMRQGGPGNSSQYAASTLANLAKEQELQVWGLRAAGACGLGRAGCIMQLSFNIQAQPQASSLRLGTAVQPLCMRCQLLDSACPAALNCLQAEIVAAGAIPACIRLLEHPNAECRLQALGGWRWPAAGSCAGPHSGAPAPHRSHS
jgi:hypothetical protein